MERKRKRGRKVSDGIKTFWIDEGWPGNLPHCSAKVAPIVSKYEREAPVKHASENDHETVPTEE